MMSVTITQNHEKPNLSLRLKDKVRVFERDPNDVMDTDATDEQTKAEEISRPEAIQIPREITIQPVIKQIVETSTAVKAPAKTRVRKGKKKQEESEFTEILKSINLKLASQEAGNNELIKKVDELEKKIDPAKFDEMARNIGKNQDDIKDLVHDAGNQEDEINKLKQNVKRLEDKVKSMEEAESGINHENIVKEISARVIEETRRTQKSSLEEHRKNTMKETHNSLKPTFVEMIEKNQGAIQKANQQLKENVSRIRERINSQVENREKNDLNIEANKSSYRNVNSNPQESQMSTRSSNIN